MNVKYGDILDVENGIIVHGCNTRGKMGSGIALQIKNRWKKVYDIYKHECDLGVNVGRVGFIWVAPNKIVANAYTQKYYGNNGKKYVDYDAIRSCFTFVLDMAQVDNLPIHYPKIGAGLGGGNWNVISNIINETLGDHEHYLWLLDSN